jgi:hypothetical protein
MPSSDSVTLDFRNPHKQDLSSLFFLFFFTMDFGLAAHTRSNLNIMRSGINLAAFILKVAPGCNTES